MNNAHKRLIRLTCLGLLVLAGLLYALSPARVPVSIAKVNRGDLSITLEEEGFTRVKERYVVSAPVDGYLHRIHVEVGDALHTGQPVASLSPVPVNALDSRVEARLSADIEGARASLSAAGQAVEQARADRDLAQTQWQRIQHLGQQGYVSRQQMDDASTRLSVREAALRIARHRVQISAQQLATLEATRQAAVGATEGHQLHVRAPVNGVVLALHTESEGPLTAGTPLADIGQPGELEVVVEVLSEDAVQMQPGTPVRFERWGGPQPLDGMVRRVEPAGFKRVSALGVEEQRVRIVCDLLAPKSAWQRLGDGYRVDALFTLQHYSNQPVIPSSALFLENGQWKVFRVIKGRANKKSLKIIANNGIKAAIKGLAEGEQVIINPSEGVAEGIAVKVDE